MELIQLSNNIICEILSKLPLIDLINCLCTNKQFYYRYIPMFRKWIQSQRVFVLIDEYGDCSDYRKHLLGVFSNLDTAVLTLLQFYNTNGKQLNCYNSSHDPNIGDGYPKWYKYHVEPDDYIEQFKEMYIAEFILDSICPSNLYHRTIEFTPKIKYIFTDNKLIQTIKDKITDYIYLKPKFFLDFIQN